MLILFVLAILSILYFLSTTSPPFIFFGQGWINLRWKHLGGFCQMHRCEYGAIEKHSSGDYNIRINNYLIAFYREDRMHRQLEFWRGIFGIEEDNETKKRRIWVAWGIAKCTKRLNEQIDYIHEDIEREKAIFALRNFL